jgi:hypothetical protein
MGNTHLRAVLFEETAMQIGCIHAMGTAFVNADKSTATRVGERRRVWVWGTARARAPTHTHTHIYIYIYIYIYTYKKLNSMV